MTTPDPAPAGRCPVCQARFRGAAECSRCGADLAPLMNLAIDAWRTRKAAQAAIETGDFERALRLAASAQQICATERGRRLQLIAGALATM